MAGQNRTPSWARCAAAGNGRRLGRRPPSIIAQVGAVRAEARQRGAELRVEKLDVTDPGDRENAWTWDIEVLLNNAGVSEGGATVDIPEESPVTASVANILRKSWGVYSGVPQGFDDRPGPEGVVLHQALVDAAAGGADRADEDVRRAVVQPAGDLVDLEQFPRVARSAVLEDLVERGGASGIEESCGLTVDSFCCLDQPGEVGETVAYPLVHTGRGLLADLLVSGAVSLSDGAGGSFSHLVTFC